LRLNNLKTHILPVLLILTLATTSALTLNTPTVNATSILEVPSASYTTIQSALASAKDGDTIKVAAGNYNENIHYDGYAQAVETGSSQPKTGVTLQGSKGTVIDGNVTLLYLREFRIDGFNISGVLTLGDSSVYGYVVDSNVTNVQVDNAAIVGGSSNILNGNCFNCGLTLQGGNTKTDIPSIKTNITDNQILQGLIIEAGSALNTVEGNNISGSAVGVLEEPSTQYFVTGANQIINNTIVCNEVGVRLYSSTSDKYAPSHSADLLVQNTIQNNTVGVEILASTNYPASNTFYHNNFVTNGMQVKINGSIVNVWDNGKEGNYWSDYNGTDSSGDGIGDSPYVINNENHDNYPLTQEWSTTANGVSEPSQTPSQTSSTPTTVNPTQPSGTIPEITPLFAVAGLLAFSILALIFFKRKAVFH
jgi:hypothetical protein